MATCDVVNGKFVIPRLVEFFHLFPHLDFNFDNTTTYFIPTDKQYQQALLLFSGSLAVFGALIFLATLIYFITWSCSNCFHCEKKRKPSKCCTAALAWFIYIAILICSGFVIAAFVFNSEVNKSTKELTTSIANINNTLLAVHNEVVDIHGELHDAQDTILDLEQKYPEIPKRALKYLDLLNRAIMDSIASLMPIRKVCLPQINDYINTGEFYRWWITIGLLSLQSILCLFAFCGTIRKSKPPYVLLILLGKVCILLTWTSCGVEFAAAVAAADLCWNPEATIEYYINNSLVSKGIIDYYVKCQPGSINPYQKYADNASRHLADCVRYLNWTLEQPFPLDARHDLLDLRSHIISSEKQLAAINKVLNCSYANQQYRKARCAICYPFETGLSNLLLSGLIFGVLFFLLLLCVASLWDSFGPSKGRKSYSALYTRGRSRTNSSTPYQSISDSPSETVPLISSALSPGYAAVGPNGDVQFHSCEEGRQDQNFGNIINPLQPSAPLLPNEMSNETPTRPRKKQRQLTGPMSMAF